MAKKMRVSTVLLCLSVVLMVCGSALGRSAQTSFGKVEVTEIEYITSAGAKTVALLYLPEHLSLTNPAPAVVATHGYVSFNDSMEHHAIELSKRGYVVMAIDAYGHGFSGLIRPDLEEVPHRDLGTYDALQYLGRLPYVDKTRIGMVGHSMGCDASQYGAWRAFQAHETDESIIVPKAVLLTSNSFLRGFDDKGGDPLLQYPLNYGIAYGDYDEFSMMMFGLPEPKDFIISKNVAMGFGFEKPDLFTYYEYGKNTPLGKVGADRSAAIRAANARTLRVAYTIPHTHAIMSYSKKSVNNVLDFFDVTLTDGTTQAKMPYAQQSWRAKNVGGAASFIGFFMFIFALGAVLLRTPYFKTIIHPEPASWTTFNTAKDKVIYVVLYVVALLVPTFTYTWSMETRFHAPYSNIMAPHKWGPTEFFRLLPLNGVLLMNLILTVFFVLLFVGVYYGLAKKAGGTMEAAGLKVSRGDFGKSLLLAAVIFISAYIVLNIVYYFFHVDFGTFKFIVRVMPDIKWKYFLNYLPLYLIYCIVVSAVVNAFTRINKQPEWVNTALIVFASVGGLLILQVWDVGLIGIFGHRMVPFLPGIKPPMPNFITSIWVYALLGIFPIVGGIHRMFYKLTGRIWTGAILNSLVLTFYAVTTAIIAQPPLY
jgi:pimeloyl-ACP methyl ester carboxylesterase